MARSSPAIKFKSVVLPDPDGPIRARNSPSSTVRSRSTSTGMRNCVAAIFLVDPSQHDRGHLGHGAMNLSRNAASRSIGASHGFVLAQRLGRVHDDRLVELRAPTRPAPGLRWWSPLRTCRLRIDVVFADDPDVVVSILVEHGRFGHEQERSGSARGCWPISLGRKWTVAASSGKSLSSGSRISTFTLTVPATPVAHRHDLPSRPRYRLEGIARDRDRRRLSQSRSATTGPPRYRSRRPSAVKVGDRDDGRPAQRRAHRHRAR